MKNPFLQLPPEVVTKLRADWRKDFKESLRKDVKIKILNEHMEGNWLVYEIEFPSVPEFIPMTMAAMPTHSETCLCDTCMTKALTQDNDFWTFKGFKTDKPEETPVLGSEVISSAPVPPPANPIAYHIVAAEQKLCYYCGNRKSSGIVMSTSTPICPDCIREHFPKK